MNKAPLDLTPLYDETVVFYNVQNLFDYHADPLNEGQAFTKIGTMSWSQNRLDKKTSLLSQVLHQITGKNPLLIGLVEIENAKVALDIAHNNELKNTTYKIVHFNSDDKRGIDCALLYDADKLKSLHEEKIQIRIPDDPEFSTRDILYFQGMDSDEQTIHVFVNHWSSRRDGVGETAEKRMAASKVLYNRLRLIQMDDPEAQVLVMGDFNDEPSDASIGNIETLLNQQEKPMMVNLMHEIQEKGIGTLVHNKKWLLYDQFLVSNNLLTPEGLHIIDKKAFVYSSEKLLHEFPDGTKKPNATFGGETYYGGYSDHLPIYLKLTK